MRLFFRCTTGLFSSSSFTFSPLNIGIATAASYSGGPSCKYTYVQMSFLAVDLFSPREAAWDHFVPPHHMRGAGGEGLNHREESPRRPSQGRFAPPAGCCVGTEQWKLHEEHVKEKTIPGRQQSHRRGWSQWWDRGWWARWRSPSGSTPASSCPRILSPQSQSERIHEIRTLTNNSKEKEKKVPLFSPIWLNFSHAWAKG